MDGQNENMQVDLSEALAQDGQLIITNEDGNGELKLETNKISLGEITFHVLHSFPCWHKWNDNTSSHCSDVSFACAATNAKQ